MSPAAAGESPSPDDRHRRPARGRLVGWVAGLSLLIAAVVALGFWIFHRTTHSRTDDVFVEAHIVNLAPQLVSGRIVRVLVEENDRVEQGQVVAEIDPTPYRDKLEEARRKHEAAQAALQSEESKLTTDRREVPIQVEMSRQSQRTAEADHLKADRALALTRVQVARTIDEAQASVRSAAAAAVLAREEYGRFTRLYQQDAASQRQAQEVTRARDSAEAELALAEARLAKAEADRLSVEVAAATVAAAQAGVGKSKSNVALSETGYEQVRSEELLVEVRRREAALAEEGVRSAEHDLAYTQIRAPFPGVIVKRYRNLGDFVSPGTSLLSLYDPALLYAVANLEETRLPGVSPGNPVEIRLDAFDRPFRGRVLWINKSTGAEFALMPRNVVSGEFTHVVQRVAVRIWIEPDDRWDQLRAGLSAHVAIGHGAGDPAWATGKARELADRETRYNHPAPPEVLGPSPGAARP